MESTLNRWTGIVAAHCEGGQPLRMELYFFDGRVRTEMRYTSCMCDLIHNFDDDESSLPFEWYYNGDARNDIGLRIGQFIYE